VEGRPKTPDRAERRSGGPRRWPPVLWLLVYSGSIFILNGANGKWDPLELALGIGLAAIACALGVYLALGPWPGHPRPRWAALLIGGVAAFYGICSLAAAVFVGPAYAIATLLAGIVPMTAAALWVATVRAKTRRLAGDAVDASAGDSDDPFPGIGADDARPLGDTPESHDDISSHDLPPGHPARRRAERRGTKRPGRPGPAA
jgi:hypothetical protein